MDTKVFGQRVRSARGDLSLREFAKRCDISHTHLDSIEKGVDPRTGKAVSISIETLERLVAGIGCSYTYLLGLTDEPDDGSLNATAVDWAFREYAQRKREILRDKEEITLRAQRGVKRALANHIDVVMRICKDTSSMAEAHQLHELELMPQRIALVTDFVERNADFLHKNMPGLTPDDQPERK